MDLRPHLKHLKYLSVHKWYVYRAGRILGVPFLRLLIHDYTKLQPIEWFPYTAHFFTFVPAPGSKGYFHKPGSNAAFDAAWKHHWTHNPHHWQFWTNENPDIAVWIAFANTMNCTAPPVDCLPMPDTYIREMVADWFGAGMAQNKPDLMGWYQENGSKMVLDDETRERVDMYIEKLRVNLVYTYAY